MADPKPRKRRVRRPDRTTLGEMSPTTLDVIERAIEVGVPLLVTALLAKPNEREREEGRDHVLRSCAGSAALCGTRPVPLRWVYCPYCATPLKAVNA